LPAKGKPVASKGSAWLIPVGVAIVLLLGVWIVETRAPGVGTDAQASVAAKQARDLSLKHLKDYDDGKLLTESDMRDLRQAAHLFESLAAYKPGDIRPWVGAAKCYQALGEDETAIERLQKGLASMAPVVAPELTDTAIEAHYLLSVSLFKKRDYPDALKEVNLAIKMFHQDSPIYLSQRASIYIQLKPPKYTEATHDLLLALTVDPKDRRCLGLLKLIGISASNAALQAAQKKLLAKDYKGAIAACTSGLAISPGFQPLLAIRGAAYLDSGKDDLARADAESLIAKDPDSKDAKILLSKLGGKG